MGALACSGRDSSKTENVRASGELHAASASQTGIFRRDDGSARPISFQAQHGDTCQVSPQGPNAASLTESMAADPDGVVRFFAPPSSSWGTKLIFACGPENGPRHEYHVDLNDASTFAPVPDSFAGPGVIGTRAALTPDQLDMSTDELLKAGCPPRPDAVKTPDLYAKWKSVVTRPFDIISSAAITALGVQSGLRFFGNGPDPWTALVQDTGGFGGSDMGFPVGAGGNNYELYVADMNNIPTSCPGGDVCETSFWGGIGGYPSNIGNPTLTGLIQSGIQFGTGAGNGTLFVEYIGTTPNAPGNPPQYIMPPPGKTLAVNDEVQVLGYPANNFLCQGANPSGIYGCFYFYDITQGWQTSAIRAFPGGNAFVGSTVEFAGEWNFVPLANGGTTVNVTYFAQAMTGEGFDYNGNPHQVVSGDPYILIEQPGESDQEINHITFSVPFGQQFQDNQPQSTVWFDWESN
ncbi:MAG TPA: hypothetical protein VKU41_31020 [Polyangiaceae bacterium]|nr:hypothetical protein [Polyangiaceae bacterium]